MSDSQSGTSASAPSRDLLGYGLVAGSFVIIGLSGSLVSWATAPGSVLLFMRFRIAAAALGVLFARRWPLRGIVRGGLWPKLLLMSAFDSGALLAYFFAIRTTGVDALREPVIPDYPRKAGPSWCGSLRGDRGLQLVAGRRT